LRRQDRERGLVFSISLLESKSGKSKKVKGKGDKQLFLESTEGSPNDAPGQGKNNLMRAAG